MLLILSEVTQEPLHEQISRQVRAKILSGHLSDGVRIPSIRALAREHRVSVITVQRAYEDLQREGLLHARPGKGFFVVDLTEDQRRSLALDRLREMLAPAIHDAVAQGLDTGQIGRIVEDLAIKPRNNLIRQHVDTTPQEEGSKE